jgi:hypothetical protein
MKEKNNLKKVNLTIKTWISDSNGIYNYKSDITNINQVDAAYTDSVYIIREKNKIIEEKQHYIYDDEIEGQILLYIRKSLKDKNSFEIVNPIRKFIEKNEYNINDLNRRPWFIVNTQNGYNNENEEYNLNEGDIIKLGRRKFEIIKKNINANYKTISLDNPENYNISKINEKKGSIFNINIKKNQYKINKRKIGNKKIIKDDSENNSLGNEINDPNNIEDEDTENENEKCRICFGSKSTRENPRLKLCSCHDSIHFECLKAYLKTKIEIRENEKLTVKTYICNKYNCDVCLKPYPVRFRIPEFDKIYELIDLNRPPELDYIILESLDYIKEHNNLKILHFVELNGDDIKIGRYDTNDIIDTDISVSRKHAILKFNKENGKLYLENLSEKFGSLILIKGNIKLKEKNIHFQVGKSYIKACLSDVAETEIKNGSIKNHVVTNSDD